MEVLTVDRANPLSSASSPSSLSQQEVATKIKQTHSLAVLLKHRSEQLLAEYVRQQGEPFSSPDFQPPAMAVPGLTSPSVPPEAWLALSNEKRLWHLAVAYATLPGLLGSVWRQQADLNPLASELHRQLEAAARQCRGLAGNLEGIMGALGVSGPPPPSSSLGGPATSAFLAKLSGYHVCRLHRDWARRSHEALGLLHTKYPL
ncbi:cardiotrophin-1 isoform X2 [Dermochelys coriacea]|uniref:cardiotrophin-1 isoform X2 n=1 Tax=Dermochelys coriacea TaxID=27794 RepID=UPI0018E7FD11|nr:cardiotrophin-1 isoform X2 [Dermochelys coriacea]